MRKLLTAVLVLVGVAAAIRDRANRPPEAELPVQPKPPRILMLAKRTASRAARRITSRRGPRPRIVRTAVGAVALPVTIAAVAALADPTTLPDAPFWLFGVPLAVGAAMLPDLIRGVLVLALSIVVALVLLVVVAWVRFGLADVDLQLVAGFAFPAAFILVIAAPSVVERLVSPLVALALTAVVVTLTYHRHDPPEDGTTLTVVNQPTNRSSDDLKPLAIELTIDARSGCSMPPRVTVSAGTSGGLEAVATDRPLVNSAKGSGLPDDSEALTPWNMTWERIDRSNRASVLDTDLNREVEVHPDLGMVRYSSGVLPSPAWIEPRSIGSCYLLIPSVMGHRAQQDAAEARRVLLNSPTWEALPDEATGVRRATIRLEVGAGGLALRNGRPPESSSANQAIWKCNQRDQYEPEFPQDSYLGCANAVVVLTEPWREELDRVMPLVLGALFAIIVELGLRAVDRWNVVRAAEHPKRDASP